MRLDIKRYLREQRGQSMVEYAYVILLIAIAVFAGVQALGLKVKSLLEQVIFP